MRHSSPSVRGLARSPGARIWSSEHGTARRHSRRSRRHRSHRRIGRCRTRQRRGAGRRVDVARRVDDRSGHRRVVHRDRRCVGACRLAVDPPCRHARRQCDERFAGDGHRRSADGAGGDRRTAVGDREPHVSLDELWAGPGRTTADPGELLVALHLPPAQDRCGSAYVRLEYRRAMEIAVVGAAAAVTLAADGTIASAAVALAAVAPTILSVDGVDQALVGCTRARARWLQRSLPNRRRRSATSGE